MALLYAVPRQNDNNVEIVEDEVLKKNKHLGCVFGLVVVTVVDSVCQVVSTVVD